MWISKKKYEELEDRIEKLESLTGDLKRYNLIKMGYVLDCIGRTLEKSKSGEITYYSYFDKSIFMPPYNKIEKSGTYTYIYSDFKEYKIDGLYLYDPKFNLDKDNKDIIYIDDKVKINDKFTTYQYTVDLKNKNYIQTK